MTNTYKVLGQSNPSATTDTDVYTVPSSTATISKDIWIANRSTAATTARVRVRVNGAAADNKQYVYYDIQVPGNDTLVLPLPPLAAGDVVTVYAGAATLSFTIAGVEVS